MLHWEEGSSEWALMDKLHAIIILYSTIEEVLSVMGNLELTHSHNYYLDLGMISPEFSFLWCSRMPPFPFHTECCNPQTSDSHIYQKKNTHRTSTAHKRLLAWLNIQYTSPYFSDGCRVKPGENTAITSPIFLMFRTWWFFLWSLQVGFAGL